MRIDVLTLFPAMFAGPLDDSIVRRARESGRLQLAIHDLRRFASGPNRVVDDRPYGGGPGMLLKPEPLFHAVEQLATSGTRVILLAPGGRSFNQALAQELASRTHLLLICGSYEGIDHRVQEALVHDEISIGDYVLTNGALPAMVIIDALTRLLPGTLGDSASAADESFSQGLLEGPQYTRPVQYRHLRVPDILLSGHHEAIARWRATQAHERTARLRPDLLDLPDRPR